jgi:hypothetical protein
MGHVRVYAVQHKDQDTGSLSQFGKQSRPPT